MSQPAIQHDEGDPKLLLDWLVVQHICEWCDEAIDDCDEKGVRQTPQRQWRCKEVNQHGYVSKHWKNWLLCRKCSSWNSFHRWIFPAIQNMPQIGESLAALLAVQPMSNEPPAQIFYVDYRYSAEDVMRGQREYGVVIDDAGGPIPIPDIKYEIMPLKRWGVVKP